MTGLSNIHAQQYASADLDNPMMSVNQAPAAVYLGGSCNYGNWREKLIGLLKVNYINPVEGDWSEAAFRRNVDDKNESDFILYVITPSSVNGFTVAAAVDDSNKHPGKTLVCYWNPSEEWLYDPRRARAMEAVAKMIAENGARFFADLETVAEFLNRSEGKTASSK